MLKKIFFIYDIQKKEVKKKIIFQQIILIISNFLETLTILSIMPVVSIFLDPEIIRNFKYFQKLDFLSSLNNEVLILYVGGICLILQICSALVSTYATFLNFRITSFLGTETARAFFKYYLDKNTLYFSSVAPLEITKNITFEIPRLIDKIIGPLFRLVTKFFLIIFIFISLLIVSYKVTLVTFLIMIIYYYFVTKIIKKKISLLDKRLSSSQGLLYKICNEGFNFIKEIKILKKENYFFEKYSSSSENFYQDLAKLPFYGAIPRLILDYFFFISITSILVILNLYNDTHSVQTMIIHIAFYAVCAPKVIPAFQSFYYEFINIKSATTSLDLFVDTFSKNKDFIKNEDKNKNYDKIFTFNKFIDFQNISFLYPKKKIKIFDGVNLRFYKNQSYAITGETGIGKSTMVDLLCGFIKPHEGNIFIDDLMLDQSSLLDWQKKVSLVKQSFYALDDSILNNIVFGESNYDKRKLQNSIIFSGLSEFIDKLPEGINYVIGDNGIKLSGGQKQRLALARAFYHLKEVLILDEATSALDTEMESKVVENILKFKNLTTILITHDYNLAKKMKNILVFDGKKFTKK